MRSRPTQCHLPPGTLRVSGAGQPPLSRRRYAHKAWGSPQLEEPPGAGGQALLLLRGH